MRFWKQSNSLLALSVVLLTILMVSCTGSQPDSDEEPLARVHHKYLYPSDLSAIVPAGMTGTDSIRYVSQYINQWIHQQLLLEQAEFNLDADKMNFEHLIQDYRASLLIHEYQKQLLAEKIDTVINGDEVEAYYNQNLGEFELSAPIVKALYIRIQKDNSRVQEIKNLLRSSSDSALESLVNLCYQYADRFDFFNDNWVAFQLITQNIPGSPEDQEAFLRSESLMETEDEQFLHLLQIHDYKLSGETAPMEYVQDRIRDMIMSDRRKVLLTELEESVFQEAVEKKEFEIYDQK